jgi:hypothetical protein
MSLKISTSVIGISMSRKFQNALKLPASVYGLLIITSVSAIALQRIRYELAELEGVALGYLLAGYQLNHLPTLLSKAF